MTRKRFVKLLMARGFSRNEANEKARYVNEGLVKYVSGYPSHTSYETALHRFSMEELSMELLTKSMRMAGITVREAKEAFGYAAKLWAEAGSC